MPAAALSLVVRAPPWAASIEVLRVIRVVLDSTMRIVYDGHGFVAGLAQRVR